MDITPTTKSVYPCTLSKDNNEKEMNGLFKFSPLSDTLKSDLNISEVNIEFICRHTNYTEEEAKQQLYRLEDPMIVIQEYMKPPPKLIPRKNTHQLIFHEISKFMEEKNKSSLQKS